jgi:uncharacterized membrane protein YecN with MAPEG domain
MSVRSKLLISMRTAVLPSHIMLQLTATAFPTPTVMQPIPVPEVLCLAIVNVYNANPMTIHNVGAIKVINRTSSDIVLRITKICCRGWEPKCPFGTPNSIRKDCMPILMERLLCLAIVNVYNANPMTIHNVGAIKVINRTSSDIPKCPFGTPNSIRKDCMPILMESTPTLGGIV